jgi:type I restriction enzyme R subunit
MTTQSEAALEIQLIERLKQSGYEEVNIHDEKSMNDNLKKQIEIHNNIILTKGEFERILIHLRSSSVFESSKKLRDKYELLRDDDTILYVEFFNMKEWCKNIFQVTHQVTMIGKRKNRYDVTILINGLPLVQIELKKRGVELKQAFHQIDRYHRDSYAGLFTYTQIFIISNGVNTKYFSNDKGQPFSNTFHWTDIDNNRINTLLDFTDAFLGKCHIAKMIAKYTVLHETLRKIMVLRPYQYYATEKIIEHVDHCPNQNGYIWHTTGSGKTLTSFKASQILTTNPKIDKIVFVVDRKDLDYQTIKEFKAFSKDSVENTKNTRSLEHQLTDTKIKLVVTTIQKLNNAISKERYLKKLDAVKDDRFVFIFDECHRTQFGDTHKKINKYFTNKQFYGFTGTPIFEKNSINKQTTKDLFGERLHSYVIKDAINDDNVLDFSVEYISTFKSKTLLDEGEDISVDDFDKVKGIDKKEVFDAPERLNNIVDFIIENHDRKTYRKSYTSLFAVSGVKNAIRYYELFKGKESDLKVATIFTYNPNEAEVYASDIDFDEKEAVFESSRDKLDIIVDDFNQAFGTNHNLDKENGFNAYYIDISKKVKEKKIDVLIVVNMFLTGFDSKPLNTLYVDKNLRYHGLIQAFSRTNRIFDDKKNHGNIVCFRNLKNRTDAAITLFSDEHAIETVIKKSYKVYLNLINNLLKDLIDIVPTVQSVDQLEGIQKADFIKRYREILRTLNIIETFTEFTFDDLVVDEQTIEDYKSKYLDIYDGIKANPDGETASILEDISFDMELIRRDYINVQYIIELLRELDVSNPGFEMDKDYIYKLIDTNEQLRSKKELIKRFNEENFIEGNEIVDLEGELHEFMDKEKKKEIEEFSDDENLSIEMMNRVIAYYEFTGRIDRDNLKHASRQDLRLLERKRKIPIWQNFVIETSAKYSW